MTEEVKQETTAQDRPRRRRKPSPVYQRLKGAGELAGSVVSGTSATAQAAAIQSAMEVRSTGDQAVDAVSGLAGTAGKSTKQVISATARSVGAVAGGVKGTAGGMLLSVSIASDALGSTTRSVASDVGGAVDKAAQGDMGAAARDAAQGLANASLNAGMGAIGASATAVGAVLGSVSGIGGSAIDSGMELADAASDLTKGVIKVTAKGAEALTDAVNSTIKAGGKLAKKVLRTPDE